MKIEMGESLVYSWLRHVKKCQIVQTNWKVSSQWDLHYTNEIEEMFHALCNYFEHTYDYKVFKKSSSLMQIIQQGECDLLGVNIQDGTPTYYAVDVAFHESGLSYGSKRETAFKVVAKNIRTAFFLYGYLGVKSADIVFASPKIHNSILRDLIPLIEYINDFFTKTGLSFRIQILCNEAFDKELLKPVLSVSKSVADTTELFMRSYQLLSMFDKVK